MYEAIIGGLLGFAGSFTLQLMNDKQKLIDLISSIQIEQAKVSSRLEESIRDIDEIRRIIQSM